MISNNYNSFIFKRLDCMSTSITRDKQEQHDTMQQYYRLHAKIYDATRWSFLYGRDAVLNHIPIDKNAEIQILEVGCGTGKNLISLANKFPKAQLLGLDISADMVRTTKNKISSFQGRIKVIEKPYEAHTEYNNRFDVILFSYALTMINPQWEDLLALAKLDLKPGGYIVFADFHDSRFNWFKNHMANNHVRMDGHILPKLKASFATHYEKISNAYGFVWEYVQFVGRK
jgi:S-adenosylmethionine-diacylgycerolhomoserine-N-methlytransferase